MVALNSRSTAVVRDFLHRTITVNDDAKDYILKHFPTAVNFIRGTLRMDRKIFVRW